MQVDAVDVGHDRGAHLVFQIIGYHRAGYLVAAGLGESEIQLFQGFVDDVAKGVISHEVGGLVVVAQALDVTQIELERAVDVLVDGTGRQVALGRAAAVGKHMLRALADADGQLGKRGNVGLDVDVLNGLPVDAFQLGDEAGGLVRADGQRAGVVDERHVAGTRNHAIEVVGRQGFLLLVRRHVECPPEVVGYHGVDGVLAWKHPLVHRQDDDVVEIEVACLQHPHHLQALQRFAAERDDRGGGEAVDEVEEGVVGHGNAMPLDALSQLCQSAGVLLDESGLQGQGGVVGGGIVVSLHLKHEGAGELRQPVEIGQHIGRVGTGRHSVHERLQTGAIEKGRVNVEFILPLNLHAQPQRFLAENSLDDGMREHVLHVLAVIDAVASGAVDAGLLVGFCHDAHERYDTRQAQRVAQRDVQFLDGRRHGVDKRQQQCLVGQHDGGVDGIGQQVAWCALLHSQKLLKRIFGLAHM